MERIKTHPILGDTPEGRLVNFTYDGKTLQGIEGEPISAALRVAGVMTHRYTKKGMSREVYFVPLVVVPTALWL